MNRIDTIARSVAAVSLLGLLIVAVLVFRSIPPTTPSLSEFSEARARHDWKQLRNLESRIPVYSIEGDVSASVSGDVSVDGAVSIDGNVDVASSGQLEVELSKISFEPNQSIPVDITNTTEVSLMENTPIEVSIVR